MAGIREKQDAFRIAGLVSHNSGMAYLGTYTQEGQLFTAEMSVTQHRHVPGAVSAFGLSDVLVQLTGLVDDASQVVPVKGRALRLAWCGLRLGFA